MNLPTRAVDTGWGRLYATATSGGAVRFSTTHPVGDAARSRVTVDTVSYDCDIELSLLTVPETQRERHYFIDDSWHVSHEDTWRGFRSRPSGGTARLDAQLELRQSLLPQLASWLYNPDGLALLQEGAEYQRTRRTVHAATAETVLEDALQRIRGMQEALAAGVDLTPHDERVLHYVVNEFEQAMASPVPICPAEPVGGHVASSAPRIDPRGI